MCHGTYIVNVMDQNNCIRTDSITVDFSTGINGINGNSFSLFPNLSSGKLNIKMNICSLSGANAVLYNSRGEKVRSFSVTERETLFDTAHLEAGIYRLSIIGGEVVSSQAFVKLD